MIVGRHPFMHMKNPLPVGTLDEQAEVYLRIAQRTAALMKSMTPEDLREARVEHGHESKENI